MGGYRKPGFMVGKSWVGNTTGSMLNDYILREMVVGHLVMLDLKRSLGNLVNGVEGIRGYSTMDLRS